MHGHWLKGYLRDGKKIESGGGSGGGGEGPLIVTLSGDSKTADKTFGEIEAALNAGRSVYVHFFAAYYPVSSCGYVEGEEFTGYVAEFFNYGASSFERAQVYSGNMNATANVFPYFGGQV